MPRARRDGTRAGEARRAKLTEVLVERVRPEATPYNIWDQKQGGLVLRVQPTGHRAFKAVYRHHGRPRWYDIGDARAIGLGDARKLAARIMLQAVEGRDPAAERK